MFPYCSRLPYWNERAIFGLPQCSSSAQIAEISALLRRNFEVGDGRGAVTLALGPTEPRVLTSAFFLLRSAYFAQYCSLFGTVMKCLVACLK